MKFLLSAMTASLACLSLAPGGRGDEIEWAPEANMDCQLFPSLLNLCFSFEFLSSARV